VTAIYLPYISIIFRSCLYVYVYITHTSQNHGVRFLARYPKSTNDVEFYENYVVGSDGTGRMEGGECGSGSERASNIHRFVLHRAPVPLIYICR